MTFRFTANKRKKKSIFSWWKIMIFALLSFTFFLVLFPQKLLLQSLMNDSTPSPLTIQYLKDLIAHDPDNIKLKLKLAEQLLAMSELTEADSLTAPYLKGVPNTKDQWKMMLLHYHILRAEAFMMSEKSSQRLLKTKALIPLLSTLARCPYLTSNVSEKLAEDALAFNQPKLAVYFYKISLKNNANHTANYYEKAAKASLFISDYKESAEFYILAMKKSSDIEKKRYFFLKAIDSLKAGNMPENALALAKENIDGLKDDKKTLFYLIETALSANKPKMAEEYVTQALELKYEE